MDFSVEPHPPAAGPGLAILWRFAEARQHLYEQRVATGQVTVSDDPVLAEHRFTNVFRASDRISQFLITNVIYDGGDRNLRDTFARILAFKLFNRIDTWCNVLRITGSISADTVTSGSFGRAVCRVAEDGPVYSAAYIMPPPQHLHGPKPVRHARLLGQMLDREMPERVAEAESLREVYNLLRTVPSLGRFLAYQFAIDLNYSRELDHDENDFVEPGPGALRGLKKCYDDPGDRRPTALIHHMHETMDISAERAGASVPELWGRRPHLIDVQNVLCEVDKYTRVAHPELSDRTERTRIKQRYQPNRERLTAWFPPDWGVNEGRPHPLRRSAPELSEQVALPM